MSVFRSQQRAGYTLLEVILSLSIGMIVVAALYATVETQLRSMQTGREVIAEAHLAQGLFNRLAADIRRSVALTPAAQAANATSSSSTNASSSATSSTPTDTSTTSTTTAPGSSTDSTSTGSSGSSSSSGSSQTSQFNFGMIGDQTSLTLFVSAPVQFTPHQANTQAGTCDLRRVMYSLVPDSGLARQDSQAFIPDAADAPVSVLAPEVVDLSFRYFDAVSGSWASTWDGTTSGPPDAVEIVLAIQSSTRKPPTSYRFVVAVPSTTPTMPSDSSGSVAP